LVVSRAAVGWRRTWASADGDVHRLDEYAFNTAANHLKHLADTDDPHRKLILVGIPQTGQRLVDLSFDLATRIDVYRFGRVSDDLVSK
jgi:hypothetical protein